MEKLMALYGISSPSGREGKMAKFIIEELKRMDQVNQTGMIGGFLQAPYLQSIRLRRCAAHLVYKIPTSI